MRFSVLASLFWLGASAFLHGQPINYQQRKDLEYDRRISKLEAERAALKEDLKNATDEITNLKKALSDATRLHFS